MYILSWWSTWFYIFYYYVPKHECVKLFTNRAYTTPPLMTRFIPKVKAQSCFLKPDTGPCRSRIRMYYFNPVHNNCSRFDWGGCQGNGNRFESNSECMNYCMSKPGKKKVPRYCSLTFDYGFCFGAVQRWYFDRMWKVCKSTIYSGCGGNKNNFYTLDQCDSVCRFGLGPKGGTGKRTTRIGQAKTVLIVNPIDDTTKAKVLLRSGNENEVYQENGNENGSPLPSAKETLKWNSVNSNGISKPIARGNGNEITTATVNDITNNNVNQNENSKRKDNNHIITIS